MENKKSYKEERFDSFLNKTIIMSSRKYFIKQMNIATKENTIMDNEDFSSFIQGFIDVNTPFVSIDELESRIVLNAAVNCLSDIEQAVIFLLFNKNISQVEAGEFLNMYDRSVYRIKKRALKKLKDYLEGDQKNEE